MEETFSIKGIILDRESFRERDSKVCVYSLERGRQDLVARGTKKITSKLAGHIEPITYAGIMGIRGKRINYLGSAMEENSYKQIKNNLDKLYYSGIALRTFKDLIREEEPEKEIFYLLKNYLDILNKEDFSKVQLELFLHFFILKLVTFLGYTPELYNCTKCKKKILPAGNRFNLSSGGIICRGCGRNKEDLTITDNCIKLLRLVINKDIRELHKIKANNSISKEAITIIRSFLQYYSF